MQYLSYFHEVSLNEANIYLEKWNHKMGALRRGKQGAVCHMLFYKGEPIAVTTASHLIRENVGGGLKLLTRENTIELSRLCAAKSDICRIALRMWREFVFPNLTFPVAITYQDSNLHNGNTYRFDGWKKVAFSHSGTDQRSGKKGRDKWIWVWPPDFISILNKKIDIKNSKHTKKEKVKSKKCTEVRRLRRRSVLSCSMENSL